MTTSIECDAVHILIRQKSHLVLPCLTRCPISMNEHCYWSFQPRLPIEELCPIAHLKKRRPPLGGGRLGRLAVTGWSGGGPEGRKPNAHRRVNQ